jgi:AraC family transcriptional regulator
MFAFIRVHDSYQSGRLLAAYDRLQAWAHAHGLNPLALTLVGASQDDPDVTPIALCSYDIGYVLPEAFTAMPSDGEVMVTHVPDSTLASIHCAGDIFVVDRAWQYLYRWWLPRSAFVPDNRPAMEMYRRHPAETGWEIYDLDCVVAVTRL